MGSKSDTSLFLRRVWTDLLLVLIYVDDIIITGNDSRAVTRLIQELGREFSLKDLGPLHYFLGVECHLHPQVSFSLNKSISVTYFFDSRWMVSSLSARLWLLPVSSPRLLASLPLTLLSIEVLLELFNT